MLQQTTVAAVVPYYERFLKRFPDITALAKAPEEAVLASWAGLGYYSRARNLRKAAQAVVAEHGGKFPSDMDAVLDLPGIGRYTAGAILSISFDQRVPLLDGNVMRVFSRLKASRDDIKDAATQKKLWAIAESLVDAERPGDWNQALMELGATVCLPETPRCGDCPLQGECQAFAQGIQEELPVVAKRRAFIELAWTCLWIERGGRILLWKRSQKERFLKGLWGLPESRHLKAAPGALVKKARHTITHHKIAVEVRQAEAPARLPEEASWSTQKQLEERLVSSLWLKLCL